MSLYKNILTGMIPFSPDWLKSLEKLNKENIFIFDFKKKDEIASLITEKNIDYILPLSDVDFMLIKKNINVPTNVKILFPEVSTYITLNNKSYFTDFMLKNFKEYIPTVYYLDNIKLQDIKYPVISKPTFSINGMGMKIYYNEQDFNKASKVIVQKFIEDEYEYGAYILCIDGEIINWKVIRFKYEKYNIKTGNFPENYEDIKNFKINLFEPIIKKINYTGGMCINFKFDKDMKKLYIFEINPRFGGSAFSHNFIYDLLCIKK